MWEGMDDPLPEGNWEVCGPSPIPYKAGSQTPRELDLAELDEIKEQFVAAARAAARAGFDLLELHCAHGYLLSSFLSPLTNRRTDRYGGSLAARLRYPLEVFDAVRAVWPQDRPMTVRISATDWCEGGLDIDDTVEIARAFAEHGAAGIDVSTGQVVSEEKPAFGRSYQTPFADRIRNEIGRKYGVAVIAVGAISSYDDVNSLILAGRADLCALGRTHLYDPQWTLHAAAEQGYAGPGASWPLPFAAGSRRPQAGRTDGPRPRLELIRAGTPRTAHARWRPSRRGGREGPVTAFALTEEQQAFAERVRAIAAEQLRPLAEAGTPGHVNRELIKAMGELGLLPRLFPGIGAGDVAVPGGRGDRPVHPAGVAGHAEHRGGDRAGPAGPRLLPGPAVRAGGDRPALAARRGRRGRGGGVRADRARGRLDAAALALRAEPDGPGWRLTGEKIWISNAPEADFYTVFARTTPGAGARGVSAFVVPADRPGLGGEHLDMISPHPIGRLVFDGVPVQAAELLGEPDRGFRVAMRTLDLFRPSVGAFAVGMAQAATDAAVAHAGTRTAFGGPLKDQQAVSHLLAEMATRTEAARLLVYAAAAAYDAGREADRRAGRPWPSCSPPRRPSSWWTRRCRSTAPARCAGVTCSSTCTARCARRASTRAPPRSSARSSPASCTAERV